MSLEVRGIEPVPVQERTGRPRQLFWVWFAANISILGLPLGTTLIALGLNVWQALLAAAIGSFGSFAIVGLISIAGLRGGAPSLTLSRAVFGIRGNILPTLVALLSRWGWETVNTTTAAFALLSMFALLFGTPVNAHEAPLLAVACIAIFILLTVAVSGMGHAFLLLVQKYATWIFGALNIFVAIFLIATIDWKAVALAPGGSASAVLIGVGIIAGGTGIGWANSGADMSRYQSPGTRVSRLLAATVWGAGIPLVILIGLGSLLSLGDPTLASATDPIAAIRALLPDWVALPYLVAAFGGLLLSNHLSVYSAGLTMLTLGITIKAGGSKRVYAVILDVVVITAGSLYFMLFAPNFYTPFITFITFLAVPITAWVAIFAIDLLRRRSYSATALMDLGPTSAYWYRGGVQVGALTSWLLGTAAGYLNSWLGQSALSWVIAFAVGAVCYLIVGPRGARARS